MCVQNVNSLNTSRVATAESLPCWLSAMQVYSPASENNTLWMVSTPVFEPLVLMLYLSLLVRGMSSNSHWNVGNGSATAEQLNTAVSPSITCKLIGPSVIVEATTKGAICRNITVACRINITHESSSYFVYLGRTGITVKK